MKMKTPPADTNLIGFLIPCNCGVSSEKVVHDVKCAVEQIMAVLHSHKMLNLVFDIIDVTPIAYYPEDAEEVKHEEVTE